MCVIVVAAPLTAGSLIPMRSMVVQSLVMIAAGLMLVRSIREGEIYLPSRAVTIAVSIFFLLLLVSAIGTYSPQSTLSESVNVFSYLIVFFMAAAIRRDRSSVDLLVWVFVVSAGVVSAVGVNEYLLHYIGGDKGWRIFSTFFNPDFLAGFLSLAAPVSLGLVLERKSFVGRILAGLCFLLTITAIPLTGSRFGLAASFFGFLVMGVLWVLSGRISRRKLLTVGLPIVILICLVPLLAAPIKSRLLSQTQSHSAAFRLGTWSGTLHMIESHPLKGTGIGTFEVGYPGYATLGYTKYTHNSYLQLASEAGIPAAAVLVFLLCAVLGPALVRTVRNSGDVVPRALMCGLLGGSAASLVRNAVDSDWYVTGIGIAFWTVVGLTACTSPKKTDRYASTAFIALFLAVIALNVTGIRSEMYIAKGRSMASDGNVPGAESAYKEAFKLAPLNTEALRLLTKVQIAYAEGTGDKRHFEDAEKSMDRAIRIEPFYAINWHLRGTLYYREGLSSEAAESYETALEHDPNSLSSMLALARAYDSVGRHEDAIGMYKRMVALEESRYDEIRAVPEVIENKYIFARVALGKDLEYKGDVDGARLQYEKAAERIGNYYKMGQGMFDILDTGGFRKADTDAAIDELNAQVNDALKRLGAQSR